MDFMISGFQSLHCLRWPHSKYTTNFSKIRLSAAELRLF